MTDQFMVRSDDVLTYEYGIWHMTSGELHREGFTLKEAQDWVSTFEADGGKRDAFRICRRLLGPWAVAKPRMDVDTLAQIIREVDGKHELGAGALAEAIVARFEN